jgi:ribosomal protein S18 acetylase RimI-like enzyme
MITVIEVSNSRLLKEFIRFPHKLYRGDPNYVPALFAAERDFFSKRKNPFFRHSDAALFLALKDGIVAGRIAAILNSVHRELYEKDTGFFGFFDCTNDFEVAQSLFGRTIDWLKEFGITRITGPECFTTNDTIGILIDGFDEPPVAFMPYNKPYYHDLLARYGFVKTMDLFSWMVRGENIPSGLFTLAQRAEDRLSAQGITIRNIRFDAVEEEIRRLRPVYNAANRDNWGFIPLDPQGFHFMAKDLKKIVPEDFVLLAVKNDEIIGFLVCAPDINRVLIRIREGRLLPTGIFKFLYYKRKIDHARVLILGIEPEFRNLGIDLCLYARIFKNAAQRNIHTAEAAYIMESNTVLNSIMKKFNAKIVKTYRIFTLQWNTPVS